ncbi:MAG: sulfatase-like hydrolase/transferase [Alphaproteobacteria bacterium]|nr:sulfatase-like hydrolase/transferase [Alphaproteobacteria bacterium]
MLLLLLACTGAPSAPAPPPPVHPALSAAPEPNPAPRTNAVVIVIDTLRADAVARAATPNLDALAARGSAVPRAWSAGTWTVPSVISMFTGMPVRQHGWDLPTGRMGRYPQLPDTPTLAQVLHEAGVRTVGLYANAYLHEALGFQRGFDVWNRTSDAVIASQLAKEVHSHWDDGGRHFAYLHLLGPHSPLHPSEAALARYGLDEALFTEHPYGLEIGVAKRGRTPGAEAAYRDGYHAAVEDADAVVGALLAALGEHRDDTVVIVTSDHGELLGEHGVFGHGWWVYEPLTNVPFIAEGVGTLPETLGIASLPALVTWGMGVPHAWPTVDHQWVPDLPLAAQREGKLALSADGKKKIVWHEATPMAFDLVVDPGEEAPLSEKETSEMATGRASWETAVPKGAVLGEDVKLPKETVERVKALGYIE